MPRLAKFVLEVAILLGSVFSPALSIRVKKRLDVFRNDPPSNFSKTLKYAEDVGVYARTAIFKAACDSSAFTCEEIIQLASFDDVDRGLYSWTANVMAFAGGRANKGCIVDPANAKSLVDSFEERWQRQWVFRSNSPRYMAKYGIQSDRLTRAFIINKAVLKPAKGRGSTPVQLQTGRRTDRDMEELLAEVKEMEKGLFFQPVGQVLEKQFKPWLKQMRANGEQFSGPQLVNLVEALPVFGGLLWFVYVLLEHLEQHVTGVTCEEVITIQRLMIRSSMVSHTNEEHRIAGLAALSSSIVDAQNKAAIVADPVVQVLGVHVSEKIEYVLRDVGVGLLPKNNRIFGVVKGNPVILVVDESDSMDANFTLGNDTFTRRQFCHSQLEMVLEGLPNGTYFNVIQYSGSAVKIFQDAVLVSKISIDAAMDKVSSTWRDDYRPGGDPVAWLRKVHGFSLKFPHQFKGGEKNSMEALQLAYATVDLPSQHWVQRLSAEPIHRCMHDHGAVIVTKDVPQIYFLTSGPPDGGAGQILEKTDEFDNGRNIPVNCIAFGNASADPLTKQFGKDLASKTGGFFRSIEQA